MKTTIVTRVVKATTLAAVMFFAFTMSAFAKPTDVSKYLMRQFQKQFQPASDVTWKTTDRFTSASFEMNKQKVSVFYNNESRLIGISKFITLQDLPKAAQQEITTLYNVNAISSMIDFTDENGNESYYIQLVSDNKQIILQSDEQGHLSNYEK